MAERGKKVRIADVFQQATSIGESEKSGDEAETKKSRKKKKAACAAQMR